MQDNIYTEPTGPSLAEYETILNNGHPADIQGERYHSFNDDSKEDLSGKI